MAEIIIEAHTTYPELDSGSIIVTVCQITNYKIING